MPSAKKRSKPAVGTVFERVYKGKTHRLEVVSHENQIMFKLNKELFSAPSTAAKYLTGSEVNGWTFWKID
jgi:hypothetical protein